MHIIFLCTGNAARSVIAGAILENRAPGVKVTTAGTHVVEGMPMSWRTRDAIAGLGVDSGGHRSRQLTDHDVATADVVICLAADHVAYMRRIHPEAATKTVTLKRIVRDLPAGPGAFGPRLARLCLADVELGPWEEVADPAGGDLPVFQACAREIGELIDRLVPLLGTAGSNEKREEIA